MDELRRGKNLSTGGSKKDIYNDQWYGKSLLDC